MRREVRRTIGRSPAHYRKTLRIRAVQILACKNQRINPESCRMFLFKLGTRKVEDRTQFYNVPMGQCRKILLQALVCDTAPGLSTAKNFEYARCWVGGALNGQLIRVWICNFAWSRTARHQTMPVNWILRDRLY